MLDRIIQVLEYSQLSKSNFAEKIGINPSGLTHILNGRNQPSLDIVKKIVTAFPEINSEWLVMGMGQMLKSDTPVEAEPVVEPTPKPTLEMRQTTLFESFDEEPEQVEETQSEVVSELVEEEPEPEPEPEPVPVKTVTTRTRTRNSDSRSSSERSKKERISNSQGDKKIVKIVFFYDDQSFDEYHPA